MIKVSRRAFFSITAAAAIGAGILALKPTPAHADPFIYNGDSKFAVDGTDVVAYFILGKPVRGSQDFTHSWNGAIWSFASAEHRDLFAATPEKYAPQYNGYCAFAAAKGYTASTVPEAWDIVDGRLYLNYSLGVQKRWQSDRSGMITSADQNWPKLAAKLERS